MNDVMGTTLKTWSQLYMCNESVSQLVNSQLSCFFIVTVILNIQICHSLDGSLSKTSNRNNHSNFSQVQMVIQNSLFHNNFYCLLYGSKCWFSFTRDYYLGKLGGSLIKEYS